MRLHAHPDRTLIRAAAPSTRYVRVAFTAPEAPARRERAPVNVALVLDRSGSMTGEKIRLAKEATAQALRLLGASDRFALVVYDDRIDVIAGTSEATAEAKRRALGALEAVEPRNSTNLADGWLRGCEQVGLALTDGQIGRCLLLTDGLANVGITDRDELVRHAAELRRRGISTSTFGVGADFDERLLQGMARDSDGNFYFIQQAAQIPDILASELGDSLEVVGREAAVIVDVAESVEVEPLSRRRWSRTGPRVRIELGDVVSGQEVELVVKLAFPQGREGDRIAARFGLTDRDDALEATEEEIRWTWASHGQNDSQRRDRVVDRAVAGLYAARARSEAVDRNRDGDLEGARRVLRATARRIREYAGDDAELTTLWHALEAESKEYSTRRLSGRELKEAAFGAHVAEMHRAFDGKTRRSPAR